MELENFLKQKVKEKKITKPLNKDAINLQLIDLLSRSYSQFHVVNNIKERLLKLGFVQLSEHNLTQIEKGKNYFITRNDSSLIAFKVPENISDIKFNITAAHTDSPTLKIKPNPVIKRNNVTLLNVEPYGGLIMPTWLDRPLSLAGRVYYEEDNQIKNSLIAIERELLFIPNVCIHMNRNINDGYKYNPAVDLLPILSTCEEDVNFENILKSELGLKDEAKILSHDLFLFNCDTPKIVGLNNDFLASSRLDDLASTYSSLLGFENATNEEAISIYAAFDNEEVGSLTRQGANSTFLKDILSRITKSLDYDYETSIANSVLLSIDNAHANHPNHPELSDQSTKVLLNNGIVIKYNANQKYTSDALSSCIVKKICENEKLNYQEYTNRSDLRGGSTLGNISNSEVSLISVDIGLAQLAMHSSYEIMGLNDIIDMVNLTKAFFSSDITISNTAITIE